MFQEEATDRKEETQSTRWEHVQPAFNFTPQDLQFTPQQAEEFLDRYMQRQAFIEEEQSRQPPPYTRIFSSPVSVPQITQSQPSTSAGTSLLLPTPSTAAIAANFLTSLQRPPHLRPPPTVSITVAKEDHKEITEFDIPSPVAPDLTIRQYENLVQAISILSDIIDYGSNDDRTRFTDFLKRSMYRQYEKIVAPLQDVAQRVRNLRNSR